LGFAPPHGRIVVGIDAAIAEPKSRGYAGWWSWEDEPEDRNPFDVAADMRAWIEERVGGRQSASAYRLPPTTYRPMIEPLLSDDAFLADLAGVPRSRGRLDLWWLGQSGYLVQWAGERVLLDPYLSDGLTRKYADTDRLHVRLTRRVVDPARLSGVTLVTSSHAHTDHLDGETLALVQHASPRLAFAGPRAIEDAVTQRLGRAPDVLLDADESVRVGTVDLHAVPAAHERLDRDERGRHRYLGYVVRLGPFAVYHSGDTVRYDGQAERLRAFGGVDVALLPVNGRDPARGVPGNLTGEEAAALARDAGARLAVPCHYEMFTFNTASPEPFARACEALGQKYRILRAGERLTLTRPDMEAPAR